eukprot:IDg5159t1
MPPSEDPRRNVGTVVFAKAKVVTSEVDCKRYFGRLWKSTYVIEVVKEVIAPPRGSRTHASVVVERALPYKQKVRAVKLVDVKQNDPSSSTSAAQHTESRQDPAVETALNLPGDNIENVTHGDAQISETHNIEHNSTPSHASPI